MNIAVIGGGITGLTAAYELTNHGHSVTVFERDTALGGLANGWKENRWEWSLERAYHHMFTNDDAILSLIKELGLGNKLIIKRPVTANLLPASLLSSTGSLTVSSPRRRGSSLKPWIPDRVGNDKYGFAQLDSPIHLMQFPGLSLTDKIRTGALAAFCKINPFWQPLENITAKRLFKTAGGQKAWDIIWEPLMKGKFGNYADFIAASWLWARIHKRTPSLVYIEGGFQTLVDALATAITKQGGVIKLQAEIPSIQYESGIMNPLGLAQGGHESWENQQKNPDSPAGRHNSLFTIHNSKFDRVLLTTPTPIAAKLVPELTTHYNLQPANSPLSIPHLHAQILILETRQPILENVYWLSITDRSFPFLAVVAHTNFMDNKHYGGNHITYIGNYLPDNHPYLKMTKDQLLKKFMPFISKLSRFTINDLRFTKSYLFTAPFAQPVHQINYSKKAPKIQTPIEGVYLTNMDSIYPWDRGTNYAVELGQKAASAVLSSQT